MEEFQVSDLDLANLNIRLINFIEKNEGIIFFRDPHSNMKSVACDQFVMSFNERYEDDLIEVCCDQVRVLFFTETDEGRRLKYILRNHDFDAGDAAFAANRSVFSRVIAGIR
jgi:hypothetical protein